MPTLPSLGTNTDVHQKDRRGPSATDLATMRIREGNKDPLSRFDAMSRVIGHWIRNAHTGRCSVDDALEAVLAYNTSMIDPPWDDPRVRHEFAAILKRDVERNGPFPERSGAATLVDGNPGKSTPPELSDDALAAAFVDRQAGWTRHVPAWGCWYIWSGQFWERDETVLVREQMRQVCRIAAATADSSSSARRIASDKTISAALRIASSDPEIASRTSDWDGHPMLLNTPGGVVDLGTGEIRRHDPGLLLTQITSASPGKGCPLWLEFLATVTGGDSALQSYLQRLAGYCLAGTNTEQMFAFLHGTGGNGKSVFLQTIGSILGSYTATATLETFAVSKSDRHLTELAGLRAARLVIVPETDAGRAWAEPRIKMVTGGEHIRANFMRCDHFEFRPQFKLIVMGNHRPALTSVGEAMRRRLHVVPFAFTIPPERRDGKLPEKLLSERDGILGWMLDGYAEWQRSGLMPPACVLEAAEDYFASEDAVGQWISEDCVMGNALRTPSSVLYGSWKSWAEAHGHDPGTAKTLGSALRSRGLRDGKVSRGRGWHGIGINRKGASGETAP